MSPTHLDRMSAEEARGWDQAEHEGAVGEGTARRRWTWSPRSQMRIRLRERRRNRRNARDPYRPRVALSLLPGSTWRPEALAACLYCCPAPRACPLHGHPEEIPF